MKRHRRPLNLCRESVRVISALDSAGVAGGALSDRLCQATLDPLRGCGSNLPSCYCVPPSYGGGSICTQ